MPELSCPHCGGVIEIQARIVQTELALGPIEYCAEKSIDGAGRDQYAGAPARTNRIESNRETCTENESNRSSASREEELIEEVAAIVGEKEFKENGRLWHFYFRHCAKALSHAVEDWKLQTPDRRRTIRNRSAWLTDRWKRALAEIAASKKFPVPELERTRYKA